MPTVTINRTDAGEALVTKSVEDFSSGSAVSSSLQRTDAGEAAVPLTKSTVSTTAANPVPITRTDAGEAPSTFMKMAYRSLLNSSSASVVGLAQQLLGDETKGLAIDFTDDSWLAATGHAGSAYILDMDTPANYYDSHPYGKLTYTSPSAKMTRGPDGLLRFGAHNLCLQSETFDDASWTKSGTTVSANAGTAPNGDSTADLVLETAATSAHQIQQSVTLLSGWTAAASIRIKKHTTARNFVWVTLSDAASHTYRQFYNIDAGVLGNGLSTAGTPTLVNRSITALDDGWYLCSLEIQMPSGSATACRLQVGHSTDGSATSYAGNTTYGFYHWGAHIRRATSDSTYLATTTAARYALPFEWDASGVLQGILPEPAATNLITYSEQFDNAAWTKSDCTVSANLTAAPDGTITADGIVEAVNANAHFLYQATGITTAQPYVWSVWLKAGARSRAFVSMSDFATEARGCIVDLSSGTILSTDPEGSVWTGLSSSIEAYNGGWYRVVFAATKSASGMAVPVITLLDGSSSAIYVGDDSVVGIYVWGAQLESGTRPTSYIPTIASTVTRAVGTITLASTLFPLSQTAGTIFCEVRPDARSAIGTFVELNDATNNERHSLGIQANNTGNYLVVDGGVSQGFATLGAAFTGAETSKFALAYAANDLAAVRDGGTPSVDASATMPTTARLQLGNRGDGGGAMAGHIRKILYLPRRMSNAELQAVTA